MTKEEFIQELAKIQIDIELVDFNPRPVSSVLQVGIDKKAIKRIIELVNQLGESQTEKPV